MARKTVSEVRRDKCDTAGMIAMASFGLMVIVLFCSAMSPTINPTVIVLWVAAALCALTAFGAWLYAVAVWYGR
jgi:hypothetical protein